MLPNRLWLLANLKRQNIVHNRWCDGRGTRLLSSSPMHRDKRRRNIYRRTDTLGVDEQVLCEVIKLWHIADSWITAYLGQYDKLAHQQHLLG